LTLDEVSPTGTLVNCILEPLMILKIEFERKKFTSNDYFFFEAFFAAGFFAFAMLCVIV